jgi:GT2 family glycosyltransferase
MQQQKISIAIPVRAYAAVLRKRPIAALEIAWWWITRRRLRARNRFGVVASSLPNHYRIWLWMHQSAGASGRVSVTSALAVHVHAGVGHAKEASAAIGSALDQLGAGDVLYITSAAPLPSGTIPDTAHSNRVYVMRELFATRARALEHVLAITEAAFLVPIDARALLTPGALDHYAQAISQESDHDSLILYADQDERAIRGERSNPWLKPEWDDELFLAQDYLSAACVLPVAAARIAAKESRIDGLPDEVAVYALLERLMRRRGARIPRHVPWVAVTTPAQDWCQPSPARRRLVQEATGLPVHEGPFGTLVLQPPLPDPPPRVSVIVPTRDRLDLLETCVSGVLHATDYPDLELIIADNDSVESQTLAYLDKVTCDPRVKVVRWPHPYNYSAVNNFAVSHASGTYLCLLNNDTQVIDPAWLRTMVAHAAKPGIGAVGARLLYPDHSVQHAGVVVGMGGAAGHAHRGLPEGDPGWFAQALITRGVTAVTAACLVVARDQFEAVGGLDEQSLAIAYNDVDLCLKLRAAGWCNLYVGQAMLIHHESKSRGLDFAPEHYNRYLRELAVFRDRWGSLDWRDPTHHPGLDPASETYRLKM